MPRFASAMSALGQERTFRDGFEPAQSASFIANRRPDRLDVPLSAELERTFKMLDDSGQGTN